MQRPVAQNKLENSKKNLNVVNETGAFSKWVRLMEKARGEKSHATVFLIEKARAGTSHAAVSLSHP